MSSEAAEELPEALRSLIHHRPGQLTPAQRQHGFIRLIRDMLHYSILRIPGALWSFKYLVASPSDAPLSLA